MRRGSWPATSPIAHSCGCGPAPRAWAGEMDATPDGLPVIDGGGGPGGLVVAAGMSGHGFGLAPVIGNIVADIADGAEPGFDLRPFRIARFHDGSHLEPAHLM